MLMVRSYHAEHTASHQHCEVKQRWARLVLPAVMGWESRVANCFIGRCIGAGASGRTSVFSHLHALTVLLCRLCAHPC